MAFKPKTVSEDIEIEVIQGDKTDKYNISFKSLTKKEQKKVEKLFIKKQKEGVKKLKLLDELEKRYKKGEKYEDLVKDVADKSIKRGLELQIELDKLDEVADGERIIDIQVEISEIAKGLSEIDELRKQELEAQIGSKDKEAVIKFALDLNDDDYIAFIDYLGDMVSKSREGKR